MTIMQFVLVVYGLVVCAIAVLIEVRPSRLEMRRRRHHRLWRSGGRVVRRALAVLIACLIGLPAQAGLQEGPRAILPWKGMWGHDTQVNITLDATADRYAWVFPIKKTGTLRGAKFCVETTTVNAATTLRLSFQDISTTTGDPDETDDQYRVTAAVSGLDNTCIDPGIVSSDGTDTGTKRSVTIGDWLGVVVKYEAFTAADTVDIQRWQNARPHLDYQIYLDLNQTGSYAKSSTDSGLTLYYDDGTVAVTGFSPAKFYAGPDMGTLVNVNSGSTPDSLGMGFTLPYPARLTGAACFYDADVATNVYLYTPSSQVLLGSLDPDIRLATSRGFQWVSGFAAQDLAAGSAYVIAYEPQAASPNGQFRYLGPYDDNEETKAHGAAGLFQYATAKDPADSGDFTLDDASFPTCFIEVIALHDGTGTGSMIFVPVE